MKFIEIGIITIRTQRQMNTLVVQTYILGAVTGLVFIAIATLVANLIKFEGGANPRDPFKRRLWFWLLFLISNSAYYLYNFFAVSSSVHHNLLARFMSANIIGTGIAAGCYLLSGFILSKMMAKSKVGNWF